jgi:hypothetical protein
MTATTAAPTRAVGLRRRTAPRRLAGAGDDLLPFDARPLPFEQAQLGCPFGSQEVSVPRHGHRSGQSCATSPLLIPAVADLADPDNLLAVCDDSACNPGPGCYSGNVPGVVSVPSSRFASHSMTVSR